MYDFAKCLILLVYFALICSLCLTVYAHPGRTDGNGGHTDHNTGEYHYHHGYSAHDHYDMDGDGDADCPYDFDDKTGSRSGSSSGSSSYTSSSSTSASRKEETVVETVVKEVPYIPTWVFVVFVAAGVALLVLIACFNSTKEDLERTIASLKRGREDQEARHKATVDKMQSDHTKSIVELRKQRDQLAIEKAKQSSELKHIREAEKARLQMDIMVGLGKLQADAHENLGEDILYRLAGAPKCHTINEDGLPISTPSSKLQWGKEYTFCMGRSAFHRPDCYYAYVGGSTNAYLL